MRSGKKLKASGSLDMLECLHAQQQRQHDENMRQQKATDEKLLGLTETLVQHLGTISQSMQAFVSALAPQDGNAQTGTS